MLTELEVGQFHAFGYVVLRQCLTPAEVAQLQAAHDRLLADAPTYRYFAPDSQTQMVAPCVQLDDAIGDLIEHPGVMEAAREIWGSECLYIGGSDIWLNWDDTPWHSDGTPGRQVKTLKTAIYLDEQDPETGALNVIPGSHHPEFCAAVLRHCGCWEQGARPRLRLDRDRVPGAVALTTRPGDVVLWDNRIWHSAWKRRDGRPRRTLFIGYAPDPGSDLLAGQELRATIQASLGERQPTVYSAEMMRRASPGRQRMAARLAELGVKQVYPAE